MKFYYNYVLIFSLLAIFNLSANLTVDALRIPKDVGERALADKEGTPPKKASQIGDEDTDDVLSPYIMAVCSTKERGRLNPGDIGHDSCLNNDNEGASARFKDDPYLDRNHKVIEMGLRIRP